MRETTFKLLEQTGATEATLRRFIECGQGCQVFFSPSEQRLILSSASCRNRMCVPCAAARRSQIANNLASFCESKHVRLMTLTLAHHNAPLPDLVTRLWASFKALRKREDWKSHVKGFAAFVEIKWSDRSKWWHVHLHVLCEGVWWGQKELANAWHTVTADSMIVDIREVKTDEGIRYASKYASKPLALADIPSEHRVAAIQALHHRRLWLVGGDWKSECKLLSTRPLPADLQLVGSLSSIINDAQCGNASAVEILTAILGGAAEEIARPIPTDIDGDFS